jgi:hypothetical protein
MRLPDKTAHGFNRVELALPSGEVRRLTREEYEALPLDQRVRAMLSKQLKFFRDDKEIPMREALS